MMRIYTHDELVQLIGDNYKLPHFWFMPELRNGTGWSADRTADALVLGLYKSKGRDLIGFEVKASRQDWQREMKDPNKSAAFADYCDYWYLVANHDVAKPEELPANWGLMLPTLRGKLKVAKMAALIAAKPIDRGILCRIIQDTRNRTIAETRKEVGADDLQEKIRKESAAAFERGRESNRAEAETQKHLAERNLKIIEDFERRSGIRLDSYGCFPELADTLRAIHEGDAGIKREIDRLESAIRSVSREMDAWRNLEKGIGKLKAAMSEMRRISV
jgi:hypothetical protein